MRTWKNVELDNKTAQHFRMFLGENKIPFETSDCSPDVINKMTHFEIFCNEKETRLCNNFLVSCDI